MTISRKGRVRITCETGFPHDARFYDETSGQELHVAGANVTFTPGEPVTAFITTYCPSVDLLTDAEIEVLTMEMHAMSYAVRDALALTEELVSLYRLTLSDEQQAELHRLHRMSEANPVKVNEVHQQRLAAKAQRTTPDGQQDTRHHTTA